MKICGTHAIALLLGILLWNSPAQAGTTQIAIAVSPKRENGEKKTSGQVTHAETLYQYTVNLTNKSFAAVTGLTAQYRIFVRDDSGKGSISQQKLTRQEFSATIPDMPNNGTYSFDTEAVKLESSTLEGGWVYTNGSRIKQAQKLAGIWIRIFQGDKVVGEYINPSTLAAKDKF